MKKLLEAVSGLLDLLPFNGAKTTIAATLELIMPIIVTQFPGLLGTGGVIEAATGVCLAVALLHKAIKRMIRRSRNQD